MHTAVTDPGRKKQACANRKRRWLVKGENTPMVAWVTLWNASASKAFPGVSWSSQGVVKQKNRKFLV